MADDNLILVGDLMEIVADVGQTYKTKVEDMTGNGQYLVGMPSHAGIPALLRKGEVYPVLYSRGEGIYSVYMSMLGYEKKDEIQYIWMNQESVPRVFQRRGAFRLPIDLKVEVRGYEEEHAAGISKLAEVGDVALLETAGTIDISVTGLALMVKQDYKPGGILVLQPIFDEKAPPSSIVCAEIRRALPENHINRHSIGVEFVGHTRSMQEFLSKYVMTEQQKQLRRGNRY